MELDKGSLIAEAESLSKSGALEESEALCRKVLTSEPGNIHANVLLGSIYARTGRGHLGLPLLRSALQLEPDQFEIYYWISVIHQTMGALPEALTFAKKAADLSPDDAMVQANLGLCFLNAYALNDAAKHLKKAVELDSSEAVYHHNYGNCLKKLGHENQAMEQYRIAISLRPDVPNSLVMLAEILTQKKLAAEAAECIRLAFETAQNKPAAYYHLAKSLVDSGLHLDAEQAVSKAISLESNVAASHALLGNILQQLGRFDEAVASFQTALELQPTRAPVYFDIVSCKRITEADQPIVDRMLALVQERSLSTSDRKALHYALGKAYNDLGDYRKAMRHYDEANGHMMMLNAIKPFDRKAHSASFDSVIQTFTPEFFETHREFGNESDLPILIVGMIRSGTTLVEQIVSSHSSIAAGGERTYLMERAQSVMVPMKGAPHIGPARHLAKGYLEMLSSVDETAKHVTDKMPHNFVHLGLVHLLFPNVKIIHCRRNPVDTCLSIYTTPFPEPLNFGHDPELIVYFYKEYQRLMEHWRKVLPSDRFMEVDYEDLITDRENTTRKLVQFCGLEWEDSFLHHEKNEGAIRTPSWWQARQPVYSSSMGRWKNYEPWLGEFKKLA